MMQSVIIDLVFLHHLTLDLRIITRRLSTGDLLSEHLYAVSIFEVIRGLQRTAPLYVLHFRKEDKKRCVL